jgi:hypothetical protein
MTETEQIERFIADKGVTHCPPGGAAAESSAGLTWKKPKTGQRGGPHWRSARSLREGAKSRRLTK